MTVLRAGKQFWCAIVVRQATMPAVIPPRRPAGRP